MTCMFSHTLFLSNRWTDCIACGVVGLADRDRVVADLTSETLVIRFDSIGEFTIMLFDEDGETFATCQDFAEEELKTVAGIVIGRGWNPRCLGRFWF